jgi:hypothetical protein
VYLALYARRAWVIFDHPYNESALPRVVGVFGCALRIRPNYGAGHGPSIASSGLPWRQDVPVTFPLGAQRAAASVDVAHRSSASRVLSAWPRGDRGRSPSGIVTAGSGHAGQAGKLGPGAAWRFCRLSRSMR